MNIDLCLHIMIMVKSLAIIHFGTKLLEDAYIKAKEMKCKKMNIGIVEENTILREWYEDNGFIHIGTKKFDFFPFTCGYMKKDL